MHGQTLTTHSRLHPPRATFQIIKSIAWTTEIEWPYPFNVVVQSLEFMDFDVLGAISASCVDEEFGAYSNHILVTSLIPVAVAALVFVTCVQTIKSRRSDLHTSLALSHPHPPPPPPHPHRYLVRIKIIGKGTPEKDEARAIAETEHASAFLLLTCALGTARIRSPTPPTPLI